METARFIKSYHPKANINPTREKVQTVLKRGWCGQRKMNGHRAQLHIFPDGRIVHFTRDGKPHTKPLTVELIKDLRAMTEGKLVVMEAEWLKGLNRMFFFDVLHAEGKTLTMSNYAERHALLCKKFKAGPHIHLLEKIETLDECMEILQGEDETVEGLVFKDQQGKGWSDNGIVRCLKVGIKVGF